jgi:heat shock protein HslJ
MVAFTRLRSTGVRLVKVGVPFVKIGVPLVTTLAVLVAACVGTAAVQPLDGRTFLSTSVKQGGADRPLVANTRIRLSFTDGRIGLSAGCNIIGGTYRVDGATLVVDAAGMTEMGCDDARHNQDDWIAAFFGSRPTLRLTGNELVLERDGLVITLLDRTVADPDLPLVGPTWTVNTILSGSTASSVPDGVVATLQFTADGAVRVETGCNTGNGRYQIDGGTIRFSQIALTRRACVGAAGEMEKAVLAMVGAEQVAYRVEAQGLTLSAGGRGLGLGAN